jgi:hypothetical protein
VRLLTLNLTEPLPGQVLPEMTATHGPEEAARRYRAVALTTLRQLRGLADARLRLQIDSPDASEAVRFWLLPKLADSWQLTDGIFRSDGWEIEIASPSDGEIILPHPSFSIDARGEILCPFLSARWVHAALLGLGRTTGEVIGPATHGDCHYFHALAPVPAAAGLLPRMLPPLPILRTGGDWHDALESPLGAGLKKAWEQEA